MSQFRTLAVACGKVLVLWYVIVQLKIFLIRYQIPIFLFYFHVQVIEICTSFYLVLHICQSLEEQTKKRCNVDEDFVLVNFSKRCLECHLGETKRHQICLCYLSLIGPYLKLSNNFELYRLGFQMGHCLPQFPNP